jgi:Uma2 family endonuclease
MGRPANRRATYQDVLDAPDNMVAEILNGELHLSPRPAGPHTIVSSVLGIEIGGAFGRGRGGPGGWHIVDEPEIHLGRHIVVPDLGGWRRERMPLYPSGPFVELPPDWVCEVLSPSTEKIDRAAKLDIYAAAGVPHIWLVNPILRTLEVLRLREQEWLRIATHVDDAKVRAEPFDAVELDLSVLWADFVV